MRIEKVILKNFRAYHNETSIDLDDLVVFVGKNDVGKSSILEALDVFFNDNKGVVKVEDDDLNKKAEQEGDTEIQIGVVFSGYPSEVDLDAGNKTTLEDEYLLNKEELLEIRKVYKKGKCTDVFVHAYHPTSELGKDLLLKKRSELKSIVEENNLQCANKNKNAELRKAIWENSGNLNLQEISIPINQKDTDAKTIWENLQRYMPVYALFQSDRPNKDHDSEVQDPLKLAVQEILKNQEIQNKLDEVAREVKQISTKVAESTLEKLRELNPEIAQQLTPSIPDSAELKWADVFKKISITSDDEIPLNKRGSGVRRLVLISFFGAEADRRKKEQGASNVIYAIEEPETSQHPNHQKFLIDSLVNLSQTGNSQVLLTTHHPATAQLLPIDSLRLVKLNDDEAMQIEGGDHVLMEIADSLGVLPSIGKVVICVEGESDRKFLLNLSNIPELESIVSLDNRQIAIIPMSGSNLKTWVNRHYLENSDVIEFHLYDRDADEKYKESIDAVNNRQDKSFGTLTLKREIENYIHKDLLSGSDQFSEINLSQINDWNNDDIVSFLCSHTDLTEGDIKSILCGKLAQGMTKSLLADIDAWDEVEGWFFKIRDLYNSRTTVQT